MSQYRAKWCFNDILLTLTISLRRYLTTLLFEVERSSMIILQKVLISTVREMFCMYVTYKTFLLFNLKSLDKNNKIFQLKSKKLF